MFTFNKASVTKIANTLFFLEFNVAWLHNLPLC